LSLANALAFAFNPSDSARERSTSSSPAGAADVFRNTRQKREKASRRVCPMGLTVTEKRACVLAALVAWSVTSAAHAQPEAAPATKQEAPARAEEPPDVLGEQQPALPPPAPPRADSQSPHPYVLFRERPRERKLELGPDFAIWHRNTEAGSSASYATGIAVGAHARIELREWLGLRLFFLWGKHGVDVDPRGLELASGTVEQPDISVTELGARIEPTWVVLPRLRLWAGAGASWARAQAPRPKITTSAGAAKTTERAGVFIELGGAAGATFDVIPEWLAVWVSGSLGAVVNESGDLFHEQQAIAADGTLLHIGGLPGMSTALATTLGVALVL
jgi:hypothetical protein